MVLKQLVIWHSAWWIVSVFSVAGFSLAYQHQPSGCLSCFQSLQTTPVPMTRDEHSGTALTHLPIFSILLLNGHTSAYFALSYTFLSFF